jgi:V/A-type H+-transporting ATPase subunit I
MKRLTLLGLKSEEKSILGALQALGAVEILSSQTAEGGDLPLLESRVQRLQSAQQQLKPFAPKAGLGPKPIYGAKALKEGLPAAMQLCEQVEELDRARGGLRGDIDKRRALIAALEPWRSLTSGIESIHATESIRYITGFLPEEGLQALQELGAAAEVYGGEKDRAVLIACLAPAYAEVTARLKNMAFKEYNFPQLSGTPQQNITALTAEIEALAQKEEALLAELGALGAQRAALCCAQDAAIIERDLAVGCASLGGTHTTFLLEGWARSDQTELIHETLERLTSKYYIAFADPGPEDDVPTVLKNSRLIAPYEAVTGLYSMPAASGIDGTPLFAPFYFIFFGMMLSDTAYGIVLAVGAYLFLRFIRPKGMMESLARVLLQGGISTIFMGLLFGTFAGMSWPDIFKGLPFASWFPLIDSAAQPIPMLAVCAGLGIVHMFFAVCIATWRCIQQKDWWGAIIDNFCWLIIISGLLMLASPAVGFPKAVATVGQWMAIGAAAAVFLFSGRAKGFTPGRFVSGAGKLYDVTAWLGDVLSYARIFALGLSTGVIGLVLNTLCWDMLFAAFKGNIVLTAIGFAITAVLSIGLHLFMMAISTLGCFIHTARLQYVEFFGKFYEVGSNVFTPLKYAPRHVEIAKE